MKRLGVALLTIAYVGIISWLGYLTTGNDLRLSFASQNKAWLLITVQVVLYGVSVLATIWFIRLLYRFSYKLAALGEIDVATPSRQAVSVLLVDFYCRAAAVWLRFAWATPMGVVFFVIPLGLIIWHTTRDPSLPGARKLLAGIPLYLYVVADACLVAWSSWRLW